MLRKLLVVCIIGAFLVVNIQVFQVVAEKNPVDADNLVYSPVESGDLWALVFHFQPFKGWVCDRDIQEILVSGGWKEDHIRVFEGSDINRKNFFDAFFWLDDLEKEEDTVLFFYNGPGHKGGIKLWDNEYYVAYPELDFLLDSLESSTIGVVLDACHSGAAGEFLRDAGRVVVTGSSSEEKIGNFMLSNLFLDGLWGLGDYQGDLDGFVSMEEAFAYVEDQWMYVAHPQVWDDYDGDLLLTRLSKEDQLDQYQTQGNRVNEVSDIRWVAQSFSPGCDELTRISLYIRRDSDTQSPLEVSIRNALDGPDISVLSVPINETGDLYRWIDLDFPDVAVTAGEPLFLVSRSSQGISGHDSYGWRGSSEDLYDGGVSYISVNGGVSWDENPYTPDCVFLIFGTPHVGSSPLTPGRPQGAASGVTGHSYLYQAVTVDPDGDFMKYGWDWDGDFLVDEWTLFFPSGEPVETLHIWDNDGVYEIRVKAQDDQGMESEWSDPLTVAMPKGIMDYLYEVVMFLKSHEFPRFHDIFFTCLEILEMIGWRI